MGRWGLLALVLLTVGCQDISVKTEATKFELQGFAISREEKKRSYGGTGISTTVTYKGRGNLVLISPSPPDGRHYEVWLRYKATCGKETIDEAFEMVKVMNGIGTVETYCGGVRSSGIGEQEGDVPQQPPTYEWGSIIAYREMGSATLSVRK
jgi:hypothetical protein